MHRTIFTTPVVNTLLRGFSLAFLRLTGWRVEGDDADGSLRLLHGEALLGSSQIKILLRTKSLIGRTVVDVAVKRELRVKVLDFSKT